MTYTDSDIYHYRDEVEKWAYEVHTRFEDVKSASITDLEYELDHLEAGIDELMSSVPCASGVEEALSAARQDSHDECVSHDHVVLSIDDMGNDGWSQDNRTNQGLITFADLADVLRDLMRATRIRNTRLGLQGLIYKLEDGTFQLGDELGDFIDEVDAEIGEAV